MNITLYNNVSPPNRINKALAFVSSLTGTLRGETNVVRPTIDIATDGSFPSCNYARIEEFGRYYYVIDTKQIRAGIWRLALKSDPLMSFDINYVSGILKESENAGSPYIEHSHFVRTVKSKTDIMTFPNGLNDNGEYILITAGGIASGSNS